MQKKIAKEMYNHKHRTRINKDMMNELYFIREIFMNETELTPWIHPYLISSTVILTEPPLGILVSKLVEIFRMIHSSGGI